MTDNYIQINDSDKIVLKIKTKDGKFTGDELTFDLNDIELPLLYQDMCFAINKNAEKLRNDFLVIEKRPDHQGKKLLTKNQEDKIKAYNEFVKKQIEAYNMFLGDNGVQKLLHGRKLGWTTIKEIDEIIDNQIAPYLTTSIDSIIDKVINKYSDSNKEELK